MKTIIYSFLIMVLKEFSIKLVFYLLNIFKFIIEVKYRLTTPHPRLNLHYFNTNKGII
jgi:hypothetical protein